MNSINDILDFRFSKHSFSEKGKKIIPTHVINLCQSRISTLNAISEKLGNPTPPVPIKGIKEVYLKFIKNFKSNNSFNDQFDNRELRTLSYSLNYKENQEISIFASPEYLAKCLSLLNSQWRDSFISGLLDCYLSNWEYSKTASFNSLSVFLTSKIASYRGSRSLFLSLKSNSKFFDKDKGDLNLGATLAISNKNISEATKFLSLPDNLITYAYFKGVIKTYFIKVKHNETLVLDQMQKVLIAHSGCEKNPTEFNKIIISEFVLKHSNSSIEFQDKIKDVAFKVVGDPGSKAWKSHGIESIEKGRELLNFWLSRQFINVFFEKCFIDERRKLFWLKYSKRISRFKVVGSILINNLLKNDKRTSEYLDGRFAFTISERDRNSALMFVLGNYLLIEFSDEGAFYAYKLSNKDAPSIERKQFHSISALKNANSNWLAYRKGYKVTSTNLEGKLGHNDGDATWEQVAEYWLKNIAGI